MFNIGPGELIVVALVLLIAVGPEQLPGVIRRAGTAIGQVKSMTDGLRSEFMSGLDEIERATDPNAWAESAGPSSVKPRPTAAEDEPAVDDTSDDDSDAEATATNGSAPTNGSEPAQRQPFDGPGSHRPQEPEPAHPSDRVDPVDDVEPVGDFEPVDDAEPASNFEPVDDIEPVDDAEPTTDPDSRESA